MANTTSFRSGSGTASCHSAWDMIFLVPYLMLRVWDNFRGFYLAFPHMLALDNINYANYWLWSYLYRVCAHSGIELVVFLIAVTKFLTRVLLWLTLRVRSIVVKKTWCQKLEVAGHTASTVRKQRVMDAHTYLDFSFSSNSGLHILDGSFCLS